MADIIHIGQRKTHLLIQKAVQKGWVEKFNKEGVDLLKITVEGKLVLSRAIELLFWMNKAHLRQEYQDLSLPVAMVHYGKEWIDYFEGDVISMILVLGPELEDINVHTLYELELVVNEIVKIRFEEKQGLIDPID